MTDDWRPRPTDIPEPVEALHRATCRLLATKGQTETAERTAVIDLGEWGNPAEIRLVCQPGQLAAHRNRSVLSYRIDGTVAAAGAARLFGGQALIDRETYAVLDLQLNIGAPIRTAR